MYGVAFAKLASRSGLPQTMPMPVETNRPPDVSLTTNGGTLDLLHQAAALKQSRYPLDLGRLSLRPYSHLDFLLQSAHLLEAEALHYADVQDSALAVRSVTAMLSLARSLAAEPLMRSHLARTECQQIAADSLEQVLNRTVLSDADLRNLTTALNEADDPESLTRAFAGQRCIGICSFDMMTPTADRSQSLVDRSLPLWQRMVIYPVLFLRFPSLLYYPSGLMHWDELRYLQFMNRYIAAAKMPFQERITAAQSFQRALVRLPWFHVLAQQWLRNMNSSVIILKDVANTARLRAARTAVAVEHYRLANGQLPPSLAALVPSYLDAVPTDPFDPASAGLQYRKLTKGYVVYSIGSNATNDNGDKKKDITFTVDR